VIAAPLCIKAETTRSKSEDNMTKFIAPASLADAICWLLDILKCNRSRQGVDGITREEHQGVYARLRGLCRVRPDALRGLSAQRAPAPEGALRPTWLVKAIAHIGTHEIAGSRDNPIIMTWAKELGGDIAREYDHDEIPWCALFANAVLHEDGKAGTSTLWALDFAKWGQKLEGPAVGAFAAMRRNGGGHITIVVGRDQHGNVMCCGGNQSDAVNIKPFDPDRIVS